MTDLVEEPNSSDSQEAAEKRSFSLLASEMYGSEYFPKEPVEDEIAPETTEVDEAEEVQEDAEVEQPEAEHADTEEIEDGKQEISSVDELVKHYELDWDWFKGLKLPVNVGGGTAEATLSDLVKSYRTEQETAKLSDEVQEKAQALEQELSQKSTAAREQLESTAALLQEAEKLLDADVSEIDWKTLREDDPAEYSARKNDIAERRQAIESIKAKALQAYQNSVQQTQGMSQEQMTERLNAERQALLDKLPEWKDESTESTEKPKMVNYLVSQIGYTPDELKGVMDHRPIVLARKAMLYDELQKNTDAAKKKVAKVPRVLKPGAPKPKEQINKERLEKLRQAHNQKGTEESALAYLRAKRGG